MKLTYFRINNFRCIDELDLHIDDFTSLIGPNNCGKSSVLSAVQKFLEQKSPLIEDFRKECGEEPMIFEGHFGDIQEWERKMPGISGIVNNNSIKLKVTYTKTDGKPSELWEAFVSREKIDGLSADRHGECSPAIKEIITTLGFNGTSYKQVSNIEIIKQYIRNNRPELILGVDELWASDGISIKNAFQQALPQPVFVPAVKDASDDAKPISSTPFGKLLNRVVMPEIKKSDEYDTLIKSVKALTDKITGEGCDQLEEVKKISDALTVKMSKLIKTSAVVTLKEPDTEDFLSKGATIKLNDGTETSIHLQGHGVQRSLIFSLIEIMAEIESNLGDSIENTKASIILFEEPELYLHPHLMRRLKDSLIEISRRHGWQIILTTHSPFLINVADNPTSLVIFQRDDPALPPTKNQLSEDPFESDSESRKERDILHATLRFHPTVNEVFFAKRNVLVEGDTEVCVLKHDKKLYLMCGIPQEKYDETTVVSCCGKWTITPIARLLTAFKINYRIIHDLDAKGKTIQELEKESGKHPYKANKKIEDVAGTSEIYLVQDTFEDVLWGRKKQSSADKPFNAWKKINSICKGADNLKHVPELEKIINFAFNW
jgi:predicted ATP-dependent endonuclease of OLD family